MCAIVIVLYCIVLLKGLFFEKKITLITVLKYGNITLVYSLPRSSLLLLLPITQISTTKKYFNIDKENLEEHGKVL